MTAGGAAGIFSRKPTCPCQYVFQRTQAWNLIHLPKSQSWERSLPPGFHPHAATRQTTRTNVTARRPSLVKPEADHILVTGDIRLLARYAPDRHTREKKGGRAIDLQQPIANLQLRGTFTERFTPLPPGTDVDGMAMVFAETMLSTAANIVPRAKRSQGPAGWCASEQTKAERLAAWQEREAARELPRVDPSNSNLTTSLKAAGKRVKRVRIEGVQRSFEEFISQLELRTKDGD